MSSLYSGDIKIRDDTIKSPSNPACKCTANAIYYDIKRGITHTCPGLPSAKRAPEPLTSSCAATIVATNSASTAPSLTTSIPEPTKAAFDELVEVCKRRDHIWSRSGGTISIGDAEELARKQLKKEKAAAVKEAKRIMRETPIVIDGIQKRKVTPTMKRRVAASQDYRCATCKIGPLADYDIDHKIPLASGGSNDIENLQMLCVSCHRLKTSIEKTK
jgi:5-methylcytosine-specific restriction enzyme A